MSEVPTHKQIAKFIKGSGYGKQHLYCQLCRKQTRSENSFKQHMTSAKHLQRALNMSGQEDKFIDKWSDDFENGMMNVLLTRFKGQKVPITTVHRQYITARSHVRLNGTRWETLEDFARYLGREGKAIVEELPGQTFTVEAKVRDTQVVNKQEKFTHEVVKERQHAMKEEDVIKARADAIAKAEQHRTFAAPTEIDLEKAKDIKITFKSTAPKAKIDTGEKDGPTSEAIEQFDSTFPDSASSDESDVDEEELPIETPPQQQSIVEENKVDSLPVASVPPVEKTRKASEEPDKKRKAPEEPEPDIDPKKKKAQRKPTWITKGIIVKVLNKELLDGKLYKQKGVIEDIFENNIAKVKMIEGGTKLKIDQAQLETVIPNIGGPIMIVNGQYKGETGTLVAINEKKFCVQVKITGDVHGGKTTWEEYEDVCKLNK